MKPQHYHKQGTVLFLCMAIIIVLGTIAFTTYSVMLTEITMNDNQANTTRALYDADAGIKLAKRQIENQLEAGVGLNTVLSTLNVTAPEGFQFDPINQFEVLVPERLFRFTVTGRSGRAQTTIETSLRRNTVISVGIFGDDQVYMFPGAVALAYDSRVDTDPSQSAVEGGSSVGSNGYLDFKTGSMLDGEVLLGGTESGTDASCSGCSTYPTAQVDYIDPDPLGLFGGALESEMLALSASNDNGTSSLITGGVLHLDSYQSGTITSGNYYLSNLELKSGSELTVDPSAGPVKFYVTDYVRIWPNSTINNTGAPMDLQIFSNTSDDIKILPDSDFSGMIYAPQADILAMPNGDYNGIVWGNNAYVKPGGTINVDIALLDQILVNKLSINHWKEVRSR